MTFEKAKRRWELERLARLEQAELRRNALQQKAPPVFERFGVKRAYVFGSTTSGRSSRNSDIDLLVIPLDQKHYWEARRALEEALRFPVDLYSQADDPAFVKGVIERGELIYDAER